MVKINPWSVKLTLRMLVYKHLTAFFFDPDVLSLKDTYE